MKRMMKFDNLNLLRSLAGACFLPAMLFFTQAALGQQVPNHPAANPTAPAAASAAKPVAAEEQETAVPNKAGAQGIKIHGHWVLDLKNPDGTVVEHRDFYNSLVTSGNQSPYGSTLLSYLLSGTGSMGGFGVALITGPGLSLLDASTFCDPGSAAGTGQLPPPANVSCYGMTTGSTSAVSFINSNPSQPVLTAGFPPSSAGILLTGNFVVPAGMGAITGVQTYMAVCPTSPSATGFNTANIPSNSCTASVNTTYPQEKIAQGAFTSTTISSMAVTTGQIVSVSVTLTFS